MLLEAHGKHNEQEQSPSTITAWVWRDGCLACKPDMKHSQKKAKNTQECLEETTDHEESRETELILKEGKKPDLEGQL